MTTASITWMESLQAGLALWRTALSRAWAPLLIYAGLYVASVAAPLPAPIGILLILIELLVWSVVSGALMRLALGDLHAGDPAFRLGPAGLQWGALETRLLGARLLLILLFFLILVAAVFCFMLFTMVVASQTAVPTTQGAGRLLSTPTGVTAVLVVAVFVLAAVWIATRLALSSPATADLGQVQVFSTLALVRGAAAWRLLAWMPLLMLAVFAAGCALRWVAPFCNLAPALTTGLRTGLALLLALVQTPLAAGVSAHAYRRLKPVAGPA